LLFCLKYGTITKEQATLGALRDKIGISVLKVIIF
jgi:hypothetical protein